MGKHVVYKNFPKEVLTMDLATYWINQICMYLGAPKELFAAAAEAREPLNEELKLKVLHPATHSSLRNIYADLLDLPARWTPQQLDHATMLAGTIINVDVINVDAFAFRENGIRLVMNVMNDKKHVVMSNATDVLRLAALLSGQEVSLRGVVKFRRFTRQERRFLVTLLDGTTNLTADLVMRPKLWKRLLCLLHPGDFKLTKVSAAYDRLYNGLDKSWSATFENALFAKDPTAVELAAERPGEFMRRLHKLVTTYGEQAVVAFREKVAEKLTTTQLLKLSGYLFTIDDRQTLCFPPRGNWGRAQILPNEKPKLGDVVFELETVINDVLSARAQAQFKHGVRVEGDLSLIKLQTNDNELAKYGRGTVFPIPENVRFIRTASYWKTEHGKHSNVWYDNGWMFFDSNWNGIGCCTWNQVSYMADGTVGALFSGDPLTSGDAEGRACQMIDLYLENLMTSGARYAAWSILAYSRRAFSMADEVLATLQWGEKAEEGKLYEPSRAQMIFSLKGDNLVKYIVLLDLQARTITYLDANLAGSVMTCDNNFLKAKVQLPAFLEHLASLPSVHDYVKFAKVSAAKSATHLSADRLLVESLKVG
jgi:hypothetical protein